MNCRPCDAGQILPPRRVASSRGWVGGERTVAVTAVLLLEEVAEKKGMCFAGSHQRRNARHLAMG